MLDQSTTSLDETATESILVGSDTTLANEIGLSSFDHSVDSGVPLSTEGAITTDAPTTSDSIEGIENIATVLSITGSAMMRPATSTTAESSVSGVTLTMINPPEGFHVTIVSGQPEWITNTWITIIESDSSEPTVVLVLVGCRGCGERGSGIVLFNFPPLTRVLFSFPGLPRFWFLCIPPGCSEPPNTPDEDENDDEDKNEDD